MKITTLALALASTLALIPVAAHADTKTTTTSKTTTKTVKAAPAPLTDAEQAVVIHVHQVNVMETTMGKLAEKSGTAGTKKYGAMMVSDHTKADKALAAIAKKHGMAKIPDFQPATDVEKKAATDTTDMEAKLKTLKGADFDAMYLPMMVDGHEQELAGEPGWIASATDADLKTLLDKRTASLTKHHDDAQALEAKAAATPAAPTAKPATKATSPATKSVK